MVKTKLSKKSRESLRIENQVEKSLIKLANYGHKNKCQDIIEGRRMRFGALGKDSFDVVDKNGKVRKNKKFFRVKYSVDYLDKPPKSYLEK